MPQNQTVRLTPAQKKECAGYAIVRSAWGKKRKRALYLYRVFPPAHKPFLPSDEALKTMAARLPDMRFYLSERFSDHDFFMVYGANRNLFTVRADAESRRLRQEFLCVVGASALPAREIRPVAREGIERFLREERFASVEWTGKQIIAIDAGRQRYEQLQKIPGPLSRSLQILRRLCQTELPFSIEAAHV